MPPELKGPLSASPAPVSTKPANSGAGDGAVSRPVSRPDKHDELRLLVNSRHPIITVQTAEEDRLGKMLLQVAVELSVPLYEWSVTTGLSKYGGAPIYNTEQPDQALVNIPLLAGDAIFWLKDFARYCDNDKICRRLRDLAHP